MTSDFRTGSASSFDDARRAAGGLPEAQTFAGLVLLYAPNFANLQPAYPFFATPIVIGRAPGCSIALAENAVSREHARIAREAGGYVVSDLGSRNGTLVNGRTVASCALEHGDELRIGDAIFKYVDHGAEAFAGCRIDGLRKPGSAAPLEELVGGVQLGAIAADIQRIAPTGLSCVVHGETGTGKELVARALHGASGRRGALQAINCAAIPANLLESELFGYRRGAFSGADRDKPGLVKLADGGTLFLDEIGDMPLEAQAKLLRVLQAREVFPLGASGPERVDLRVVCASHRDLGAMVSSGHFRGDLFARLNEHVIKLPPLRDRKEDVLLLVRTFAARLNRPEIRVDFSFMLALLHYDWPYNVRELESCIKRAIALATAATLEASHLPPAIAEAMNTYGTRAAPAPETPAGALASGLRSQPSEPQLRALLASHHGNVAAVGRALGKERMQIHRWIKRYGIALGDYRPGDADRRDG